MRGISLWSGTSRCSPFSLKVTDKVMVSITEVHGQTVYHDQPCIVWGIPFSAKRRARLPWHHRIQAVHCRRTTLINSRNSSASNMVQNACFNCSDLNDCGRMEIDGGLAPGAVVGHTTTHGGCGHPRLLAPNRDQFLHNTLRAKFLRGNINIYLHFVSFLHIDTTQVVEILPQTRQEPTYST